MKLTLKKILFVTGLILIAWNVAYFGVLRSWHQRWGASKQERTAVLPGDVVFPNAAGQVTHAITVNTAPDAIWPWLMQIGQDRSGFYSYTPLENVVRCEMPEVHRIMPEWPARTRGETVWFCTPKHYNAMGKMIAAVVEPEKAFAIIAPGDWTRIQAGGHAEQAMWEFVLEPVGPQQTRLIARVRGCPPKTLGARAASIFFWEPVHFLMERRMLLTIKELSERNATVRAAQS